MCTGVCHDAQARQGLHYALGPSKSFSQEPTLSLPSSDRSADALTNYPILARRLKRAGRILLRRQQGLSELHCGSARSLHLRWTRSNQILFSSQKPLSLSSLYWDWICIKWKPDLNKRESETFRQNNSKHTEWLATARRERRRGETWTM